MNQYAGHFYKVTDSAITPTGELERYPAETVEDAASHCLYSHRLHNRNAHLLSGSKQIVVCPQHGQIAVVRSWEYEALVNGVFPS
jgi:hypothetical protein